MCNKCFLVLSLLLCVVTTSQIIGGTTLCYKHFRMQTGLKTSGLARKHLIICVNN